MSGGRYVLHHDGTWFYYLAEAMAWTGAEFAADGEPMTPSQSRYWYAAGHEAAVITMCRPQPEVVTGYRLRHPDTASVRYPLEMDPEDYAERGLDDEAVSGLYARVTEPAGPLTEEVAGPWLRLDGEPPPDDGRRWRADLPWELGSRPEYLHLFPGRMTGFRDVIEAEVKALPRVRYVLDGERAHRGVYLEVTIEVPFDKPLTSYRPTRNLDGSVSRSRKGRTVTEMATRTLRLDVPSAIAGESRALAAAEWDARRAEILDDVAAATVTACAACRGTGHVISGSEDREKETR